MANGSSEGLALKRTLFRIGRYTVTGGIAALVDLGVFAVLCRAMVPVGPAAVASFLAAAGVNYTLTSTFVFANALSRRGFYRFFLFAVVGLVINVCVTVSVATVFAINPLFAKLSGIGIAFFFNYAFNAIYVFDREFVQ